MLRACSDRPAQWSQSVGHANTLIGELLVHLAEGCVLPADRRDILDPELAEELHVRGLVIVVSP